MNLDICELEKELLLKNLVVGLELCKQKGIKVTDVIKTFSPRERSENLEYFDTDYQIVRVKVINKNEIELIIARPFIK